jgi:hypothetical protein
MVNRKRINVAAISRPPWIRCAADRGLLSWNLCSLKKVQQADKIESPSALTATIQLSICHN